MQKPLRHNNHWKSSFRVHINTFNKAKALLDKEEYHKARTLLETSICPDLESEFEEGAKVASLYAWVLFSLKSFEVLDSFFDGLGFDTIKKYPEIQIVKIRRQILGEHLEEAIDTCRSYLETNKERFSPLTAEFLFAKGLAEYKIGNSHKAIEDLEISFSLHSLLGDKMGMGRTSNYIGFTYLRMAKYSEALNWQGRALKAFSSLDLIKKQSMVLLNRGISYYKIGLFAEALQSLDKSHEIGTNISSINRQLFTNIALGNVHRIKRDFKKSRQHLHTAYGQAQKLQFPREEALALEFLGDVYRDESLFDDARRFYNRALAIGMTIAPKGDIVMEVHRRLGECDLEQCEPKNAQENLAIALRLAKAQEDRYEEAIILRVMSKVWHYLGELNETQRCIDESIEILEEIGAKHELGISLLRAAEFAVSEIEQGRPSLPVDIMINRAWSLSTRALEQFIKVDIPWWTERCQRLIKSVRILRSNHSSDSLVKFSTSKESLQAYQPQKVIIHKSQQMKDLLQLCDVFAQTPEPALIVGETGTGKELLAHRLHALSTRATQNLVSVNVSAIPSTLFEREFFGHVKGAFSGAGKDSMGYAGRAHGGTLFLDEIGDLPLEVQPKLLRLLQDGTYLALGDPKERHSDIRLVAATNADLIKKVQQGDFRSDLYYRLKILELELPPLRHRPEDILLLVRHFLCESAGHPVNLLDFFDRNSLDQLERYEWPGNVREVAMVARRAQVEMMVKGKVDLYLQRPNGGRIRITSNQSPEGPNPPGEGLCSRSDAVERTRILMALEEAGGNRKQAADRLEMSRATLYRRMDQLGLKKS